MHCPCACSVHKDKKNWKPKDCINIASDCAHIFASLRKLKAGMRSSSLILLLWFLLLHQVEGFPRGGRGGGGGRGGRGGGGGYHGIHYTPSYSSAPIWRYLPGRWSYTTKSGSSQRPYPSFFGSDIWVKSEPNLIYLSKIWVKTRPKKRVFATYPVSRQKCVFGLVWFGHDYGLWSKVKLSIW